MKKCLTIIAFCFIVYAVRAQHEGIERHFDEYIFGDFTTRGNYYSSDTLTDSFHLFRNTDNFIYSAGSIGSAHIPMFYYKQYQDADFVFFTPYTPFISTLQGSTYFDTRTPFTRIVFVGGEKQLDNVRLVHTQNIRPWLNFGAEFNSLNNEGHYAMQQTKIQSLNAFVSITKHRYNNHLNFIYNKISHENNGGIESDEIFEAGSQRSENLSVNLFSSTTKLSQIGFSYYHELLIGKKLIYTIYQNNDTIQKISYKSRLIFSQSLSYNRYYRVYHDVPGDFYENIYIDSTETYDSVSLRKFSHSFDAKYLIQGEANSIPHSIAMAGFITDLCWYGNNDFLTENSIYGRWFSDTRRLQWDVTGRFYFTGYYAGDLSSIVQLLYYPDKDKNHMLKFSPGYSLTRPDYFYSHYHANHFMWGTNLPKSSRTNLSLTYEYVKWQLHSSLSYQYLDGFLYFDTDANPKVSSANCQVVSAEIGKKLNVGKFHWYNQLQLQYLSNDSILSLPLLGAYSSLYFQSPLFKKVLILQIGVDMTYFSSAFGYAYMPATGIFYRNTEKKYGNYFVFDAYASIKVKRFRAFVKASHLNDFFMPSNYYGLLHYPADPFSVNFGISWEFYN